jgi:hypothetical protein
MMLTPPLELAARGGVLVVVQELGVDLPGQIHLQHGIDREDVIIHADDGWVVDVLGGIAFHARVIVQRLIQRLRASREVRGMRSLASTTRWSHTRAAAML